jgi:hypothetical protein
MRDAGTVTISPTGTAGGPLSGGISGTLVTGAAASPDGHRIAIRTYTDAYEWDVPDGDYAAALTGGEPRRTPIPGERQGESITYTTDGTAFVTTSEGVGAAIQRWTPAQRPATSATASPPASAAATASGSAGERGDPAGVSWQGVAIGAISACVFGLAAVAALVAARRAWRRMRRHSR